MLITTNGKVVIEPDSWNEVTKCIGRICNEENYGSPDSVLHANIDKLLKCFINAFFYMARFVRKPIDHTHNDVI